MNRDRATFGPRVPLLLVLVATVGLAYGALLQFTSVLTPYRFPIPYAVPLFDIPFVLVATGIAYLCLERHRIRQDFQSAAMGTSLFLAALLAIGHILTQPDYPFSQGVNPGLAPYLFFASYLAGLTGVALGTQYADRQLPLTDRSRMMVILGCVVLSALIGVMVYIVCPLLPSLVMPPGRLTPFAVWTAGIVNGVVAVWALWGWRRGLSQPRTSQEFVNLPALAAFVWVLGLVGFLLFPYRYAVSWYVAGLARPFGVGVLFVALLRDQVWLYREARSRVRDLERLHEASQALVTTLGHDAGLQGYGRRSLEAVSEQGILDDAVETARDLLHADGVALFLAGASGRLRLAAAVSWPTDVAETAAAVELVAQSALDRKETVELEDITRDGSIAAAGGLDTLGLRSILMARLGAQERPVGVLVSGYRQPRRFGDEDRRVLTGLAHHLVVALDKVRVHAELRSNLQRLQETQAQLMQADKLKALGTLLSGVAHELNNPLSTIRLSIQLVRRTALMDDGLTRRMDVMETACVRASRIIRDLLAFARRQPPERRRVDLNQVIHSTLGLQTSQLELNRIRVVTALTPIPEIWADPHQLQQVFLNLFSNAIHAMKTARGHGVLTVTSGQRGSEVVVAIDDDGRGIPPEHLGRIFDPFFTTKVTGAGTGLGLSLAIGIVESHGGRLYAENLPDSGARFTVQLPVNQRAEAETPAPPEPRVAAAASGNVLVVEDEDPLRDALTEVLHGLGHRVVGARTGSEALSRLRERTWDLVMLDLRLPDVDGQSVWERALAPNLRLADRVVFMTGDIMSAETQGFLAEARRPFLLKPFTMDEVGRVVSEVLATASR
jgi:signal transduction histidine kinase/ActR/RegA family two-component response regulator